VLLRRLLCLGRRLRVRLALLFCLPPSWLVAVRLSNLMYGGMRLEGHASFLRFCCMALSHCLHPAPRSTLDTVAAVLLALCTAGSWPALLCRTYYT